MNTSCISGKWKYFLIYRINAITSITSYKNVKNSKAITIKSSIFSKNKDTANMGFLPVLSALTFNNVKSLMSLHLKYWKNVNFHARQHEFFWTRGVPGPFCCPHTGILHQMYPEIWAGRGSVFSLPARSSELNLHRLSFMEQKGQRYI